jgi:hypothetical protein
MPPEHKKLIRIIRNWSFGFDLMPHVDGYVGMLWVKRHEMFQTRAHTRAECLDNAYTHIRDHVWRVVNDF